MGAGSWPSAASLPAPTALAPCLARLAATGWQRQLHVHAWRCSCPGCLPCQAQPAAPHPATPKRPPPTTTTTPHHHHHHHSPTHQIHTMRPQVLLSAVGAGAAAKLADVALSRLHTRTYLSDFSHIGTFAW